MKEVSVRLPLNESRGYKIHVGAGAINDIASYIKLEKYSKVFIVTDDAVAPLLLGKLEKALPGAASVVLPAGEKHKNLETLQKVWQALYEAGCDRKSLLVNLGGGVIGDMGGLAASTYMRGIDFLNVPTTLLSQVDSSVGGKTGINYAGIKNLVGTFDQPVAVIIDPDLLSSLPEREFVSGFGEIIKHGLIWDKSHFEKATAKKPLDYSQSELVDIIVESCRIKLAIIQGDIKEGSDRRLVNFGHTVGHAIEALSLDSSDALLHGEAVSIGMVAESDMAVRLGLLASEDADRIGKALKHAGLPVSIKGLSMSAVLDKMRSDKKNIGGKLNFTLIDRIGHAVYDREVPEQTVAEALKIILD